MRRSRRPQLPTLDARYSAIRDQEIEDRGILVRQYLDSRKADTRTGRSQYVKGMEYI